MKGRKLLALLLAVALCAGLAAPVLAAGTNATHADFADLMVVNPVTGGYQWEWAWNTVDDAIRRGLFIGYTPYKDAQGNTITNFGPGDMVTEAVGLTLCARMMVDSDQRKVILNDRLAQMREIIPGTANNPDDPAAPYMWFRNEAATCLELGVVEEKDLVLLRDGERLGKAMTKADFAVYLVRAMGLEDFAKGLDASELPFNDQDKIGRAYRPYVKLLYSYGVLTGDESRNFNPNSGMNRAVCATMLSRAIESIKEARNVAVELPRYTTYDFAVGYIQDVTVDGEGVRTLKLKDMKGDFSVKLPSGVSIYQYNMPAKTTDLKTGVFAKVCYKGTGEALMVRLTPAGLLSSIEGKCGGVDKTHVVVDGVSYALDRFTQISAGGKVGDVSIIDPEAGYTDAQLVANSQKVVTTLTLTGGTRQVEGILADVSTVNLGATQKTTATVNAFSGLPTNYDITDAVAVTAKGQPLADGLKASFKGHHVTLRVADDDSANLKAMDIDIDNQYVQGILENLNLKTTPVRVEITRSGEYKKTPYEVDEDCAVTYEGKVTELGKLPANVFVTAKLEGATITDLSAWTGLETVSGTLTGLTYGEPTTLVVTKEDNTTSEFVIPLDSLKNITILVNGEDADITKLGTGDKVVVTLHYHNVNQIDVTPRPADVTGTLDSLTFKNDGSAVLTLRLADGSTADYSAASNTTVTREGKPVAFTEIVNARGQVISLVTEGERAISIQFSGAAVSQDQVEGIIIAREDQERMVTILPSGANAKPVNVHVAAGVNILDVVNNRVLSNSSRLDLNDTIVAYGSYGADGTFEAKSVVRTK